MSEEDETTQPTSVSFLDLLALLFIGLKLTGYITWSWVWVLSPLWLPLAVFLAVITCFFTVTLLFMWLSILFSGGNSK